ncbi:uncharacterized protein METZ01_LOCUS101203, partial [marine metagenome]
HLYHLQQLIEFIKTAFLLTKSQQLVMISFCKKASRLVFM